MELTPDFKELLTLLNDNEVKYLVVGGYFSKCGTIRKNK